MDPTASSVWRDGSAPVTPPRGLLGEPGTTVSMPSPADCMVPADFIVFRVKTATPTCMSCSSNFFAQDQRPGAWQQRGVFAARARLPGVHVSARAATGNRPTTSIMASALTLSVRARYPGEHHSWRLLDSDQWALSWATSRSSPPRGSTGALDAQDQSHPRSSSTTARIDEVALSELIGAQGARGPSLPPSSDARRPGFQVQSRFADLFSL